MRSGSPSAILRYDEGDGDLLTEATTHISEIAFDLDEPTSAAEAWIDFLNWRREPESASDPEAVLTAFDEIIRAAEMDGEPHDCRQIRLPPGPVPEVGRGRRSAGNGRQLAGRPTSRSSRGRSLGSGAIACHSGTFGNLGDVSDRSPGSGCPAIEKSPKTERNDLHGLPATASSLPQRRPRAAHRRQDDGDPPRQAPRGVRQQPQRRHRGQPDLGKHEHRGADQEPQQGAGGQAHGGAQQRRRPRQPLACSGRSWARTAAAQPTGALADGDRPRPSAGSTRSRTAVNKAGAGRFGSGWAWLVVDRTASSPSTRTPNQDNPLMDGVRHADPRRRRLGARLLPEVPEPPPRLPRRLVEHGQLGRRRQAIHGRRRQVTPRPSKSDTRPVCRRVVFMPRAVPAGSPIRR